MPGIAAGVTRDQAAFYWHLGDFRAIYTFDQDIQQRADRKAPLNISDYERMAWDDAIDNQLGVFSMPVFVGIGNHETIAPFKTREQFIVQFADWLNAPVLREQRLRDNPKDHRLKTYYHWIQDGIDFIYLDNATDDQFDNAQMRWFESVLARDAQDGAIRTVVVGTHAALPDSLASSHSMNNSPAGEESGRRAYRDLLKLQNENHKRVYILSSHSHFYIADVYDSPAWRANGGVLPGWIVGTAGAIRYALPKDLPAGHEAKTNIYGYLLATVNPKGQPAGTIRFDFHEVKEADVPAAVVSRFGPALVHDCFVNNSEAH